MKSLVFPLLLLGALDPLADYDADSMHGCDCNRKRPLAAADVPEKVPEIAPALMLIDTAQVAPLSNVPSMQLSGMRGTDLGVSFVRDGQLVFLFGDSTPDGRGLACCDDSVALTADTAWKQRQPIEFLTAKDGTFLRLAAPGVRLQGMEVPVEGVAAGADTYVFFSSGWSEDTARHDFLVLSKTQGLDFAGLRTLWVEPSERFINVQFVEHDGEYFVFGSGTYRKSAVYLARVAKSDLARFDAWRYLHRDPSGAVSYVSDQRAASQIVNDPCVGELSVRYEPKLSLYLMTYNCHMPRGIQLRTAAHPEGPWSQPITIFDPFQHGYGKFMHQAGVEDHLSDPGREHEWGGEYGPYLVPSWTSVEWNGDVSLYYALSSWNPYQAHIVRSTVRKK
jgi:hypothetical protein